MDTHKKSSFKKSQFKLTEKLKEIEIYSLNQFYHFYNYRLPLFLIKMWMLLNLKKKQKQQTHDFQETAPFRN